MQAPELMELRIGPLAQLHDPSVIGPALARFDPAGTANETIAETGEEFMLAWFDAASADDDARARIESALKETGLDAGMISWRALGDADWSMAWQAHWRAMPIGERLWVRPSFREAAPEGRIDIVLDPGMAFGTGQHETTRLCLEAIECAASGENAPQTLLDMGAGSGILAIAAVKLGVSHALAIDNDANAVAACRRNAEINDVRLDARLDDTPPDEIFDLVVANILAGPLIDMAEALARTVGNRLILSGVLESQAADVAKAYEGCGLHADRQNQLGEWVSLEFCRETVRSA